MQNSAVMCLATWKEDTGHQGVGNKVGEGSIKNQTSTCRFPVLKALIITLWVHFSQRCVLLLTFPETLSLTAGVVGMHLRNLEKDRKGSDSLGRNPCQ